MRLSLVDRSRSCSSDLFLMNPRCAGRGNHPETRNTGRSVAPAVALCFGSVTGIATDTVCISGQDRIAQERLIRKLFQRATFLGIEANGDLPGTKGTETGLG